MRKTFYKACPDKTIMWEWQKVEKNYLEGFWKDKDGTKHPLKEGMTKHNAKFIGICNDIIKMYSALIMVELALLHIVSSFIPEKDCSSLYGLVWRLVKAQSGTVRYHRALKKSLKWYSVTKQDIYDSINKGLKSTLTRYDSNKNILEIWLDDYGFAEIVDCIARKSGLSFFDYTLDFAGDYMCEHPFDEERKDYFKQMDEVFSSHLLEMASENGIDMRTIVAEHTKVRQAIAIEKKIIATNAEKERKRKAFESVAEAIIQKDNVELFKLSEYEDVATTHFAHEISFLRNRFGVLQSGFGGVANYIAIATKQTCYYATKSGALTRDITKALFFANNEKDNFNEMIERIREKYPYRYVQCASI